MRREEEEEGRMKEPIYTTQCSKTNIVAALTNCQQG